MNQKILKSALTLGVCFGVVQIASAQAMNSESSTQTAASEYVTMRLNLVPGSKYRTTQVSQTRMTIVTPPMGRKAAQKVEISGSSTNVLNYAFLYNNPDGTTQLRLTYGDMNSKMAMKVDGKTQALPENSATKALRGQVIEMKISPEGQISDVRGLDNLWKKAFASSKSSGMTPQMQRQLQDGMKKMFGEDFVKSMMQQSGMVLPENPVRIGGAWTQRVETNGQLPLVVNVRRTLKSRENGELTIGEEGALSIGDAQKTVSFGPAAMQMAISGTYSGTTVLDETTSFTRSANLTQRYGGTVAGKNSANGAKVSMRLYGLVTTQINVAKIG